MGTQRRSVLAIVATPDDRASTENLHRILEEIDRRDGCRTSLWYLRRWEHQRPVQRGRVVDDLRRWAPAAALSAVGLERAAGSVRGARLRLWLREVRPDLVILDDGVGERVVSSLAPAPTLVVRRNPRPSTDAPGEMPPRRRPSLVVAHHSLLDDRGRLEDWDGPTVAEHHFEPDDVVHRSMADAPTRSRTRARLGLPEDRTLVVGWGDDGWLDGPDLFVRTIWSLRHHHALDVHGAWFGLQRDPHEADRILQDAARAGVGDAISILADPGPDDRLCGDVVMFPYRSAADPRDLRATILSGAAVVAFEGADLADPAVRVIEDLDVDAAAAAIAQAAAEDRDRRWATQRIRFDVAVLVDRILGLAD